MTKSIIPRVHNIKKRECRTPIIALTNTLRKSGYYSISLCFINTSRVLTRNANALMEARCIKQVNRFMDEVI